MSDDQIKNIEKTLDQEDQNPELKKIDRDFRKKVHEKSSSSDTNPYNLFDITKSASTDEIRRRYHELSRNYHPDRFFRKELGPYKRKLESLFSRIQKAYAILKNPIEKEALDRQIALQNRPAPAPDSGRYMKMSPEMERMGKAETEYKKGLEFEKNKNYLEAYVSFVAAIKLIPNREIYKTAKERVQTGAFMQRSKDMLVVCKKTILGSGYSEEVLQKLDEIMRIDSKSAECQTILAQTIVALRKLDRLADAKQMLMRAKSSTGDLDVQLSLAKALILSGDAKGAEKEVKDILKKKPTHEEAKKFLDKLKQMNK